jgi:hypothetical protein
MIDLLKSFTLLDEPFELVKWVLLSGPIADRPKSYSSVEELLRAYIDRHTRYTVTALDFDDNDDYFITIKTVVDEMNFRLPDWLQNLGNGETAIFAFRFEKDGKHYPYQCETVEPEKFVVEVLEQWQRVRRWE